MDFGDRSVGSLDIPGGILIGCRLSAAAKTVHPAHVHGQGFVVFGEDSAADFLQFATCISAPVGCAKGDGKGNGPGLVVKAVHEFERVFEMDDIKVHDVKMVKGRESGWDREMRVEFEVFYILKKNWIR
jgi:hypothetical protein